MQRTLLVAALATGLIGGCAPPDHEAALRELVAEAAAAAEARDTGFFRRVISDDYADGAGRNRDDVVDRVRGYFFLNSRVEVLTRVESIELLGDDAAEMVVQAALVGGRSALDVDAGFRRIELELIRDGGEWRIIAAGWGDDR